MFIKGP